MNSCRPEPSLLITKSLGSLTVEGGGMNLHSSSIYSPSLMFGVSIFLGFIFFNMSNSSSSSDSLSRFKLTESFVLHFPFENT